MYVAAAAAAYIVRALMSIKCSLGLDSRYVQKQRDLSSVRASSRATRSAILAQIYAALER